MQIYLDDNPIDAPDGALATALAAGVRSAEAAGRIIVEIHADGRPVDEADLTEPPDRDPYASELRLVSVEPRAFLRTTLHDASDALEDARAAQSRAGELLQQGRAAEAMEPIADALAVWQMTRRVVQDGAALLGADAADLLKRGDEAPAELLGRLAELLDELKRAMGAEDWSAAADVLAYDLDEQIDRWQNAARGCAESLKDQGADPEEQDVTASTGEKKPGKVDDLMEKASRALNDTDYFACERLCLEALRQAHAVEDYERMARILLPLQEARRQKRLAAIDIGAVHVLNKQPAEDDLAIEPGCWLIEPPLVGADGRRLRKRADREQIPVLVVVHEPLTQLNRWPIVMIGPVTVRAYVAPPDEVTPEWMLEANEALGDEAIADVDRELPAATRVDRLLDRLGAVPEHEKLHQALEAACHDALREAAEA